MINFSDITGRGFLLIRPEFLFFLTFVIDTINEYRC